MLFLRLACLVAGILVLIAPPALLFPSGPVNPSGLLIASQLAAVLLPAAALLFVGMNLHRIRRSPALARMCAIALSIPLLASVITLWRSADPATLCMTGLLLGFTMMLALALAGRMLRLPSQNRLRYRALHH